MTRYYLSRGGPDDATAPTTTPTTTPGWAAFVTGAQTIVGSKTTAPGTAVFQERPSGSSAGVAKSLSLGLPVETASRALVGTVRVAVRAARRNSGTRWLAAQLVVVKPDGTLRGIAAPLFTGAAFTPATTSTNVLAAEAAMNGLVTQPGDRVVLEVGSGGGIALDIVTGDGGTSDVPFANATATMTGTERSWFEINMAGPPDAPTGLTVTDVTTDSAVVSWTPPTSGTVPTGYDLELQDADMVMDPPVTLGLVTTRALADLAPSMAYLVRVRARAGTYVSPWTPWVDFTTLDPARYRAVVRIGDHVWDVDAGDPPAYGPTLPLSFGWSVPEDSLGFPAQPDPDLANIELVTASADDMAGVDIGTTVLVSFYFGGEDRPLATFRGRVGDLEAWPHDIAPGALGWRVLGVGYTADLGGRQVGTGEWPSESGDARAERIMAEAGFPGWSTNGPIGTAWEARQPSAMTAREALEAVSAHGVSAQGNPHGPAQRMVFHPLTDAEGDLDPDTPFVGRLAVRTTTALDRIRAGLVNRRTSWRRTKLLDATWVKIDHPGGPTVFGDPRGPAYPPISTSVVDPTELADLVLDTTPGFRWLTGDALRLEIWAANSTTRNIVKQWFYRDPSGPSLPWVGRAVVVDQIAQAPDASTTYAGMLSAATVVLEHAGLGGRLVVLFRLRPEIPAHSTVTMRWMDEPAGATWADELATDPTGTWRDYYTRLRP